MGTPRTRRAGDSERQIKKCELIRWSWGITCKPFSLGPAYFDQDKGRKKKEGGGRLTATSIGDFGEGNRRTRRQKSKTWHRGFPSSSRLDVKFVKTGIEGGGKNKEALDW